MIQTADVQSGGERAGMTCHRIGDLNYLLTVRYLS